MKSFTFTLLSVAMTVASATSLRPVSYLNIAVVVDENTSAAEVNKLMKKNNLPAIPSFIELTNASSKKVTVQYQEQSEKIQAQLNVLGKIVTNKDLSLKVDAGPNESGGSCYTGLPGDAVKFIKALAGDVYTEQLNIWAWKYKKSATYEQENLDQIGGEKEFEKFLSEGSKVWKEWRGKGEALLVLYAEGDDGDDVNEAIIPLCK
jgi:hypothetical protein